MTNDSINKIPWWIMVLALITTVVGIADHGLWTPDEPRVAQLVESFSLPGATLLYPTLAQKPFVEKPPLYFWAGLLTQKTFSPWLGRIGSIRAASALCALLCALLVWGISRNFLGVGRGGAAGGACLTMIGFFHAGHWLISDPPLMLMVGGAIMLGAYGEEFDHPSAVLGAFVCAGLAFLAKGLIGPALIAPGALAILIIYRNKIKNKLGLHLCGLGLGAAIVLAWVIPFKLQAPPAAWKAWFWDNQIGRFMGSTIQLGHIRGPFYYLGILPLLLLPWTSVLAGILTNRRWKEIAESSPEKRWIQICLVWGLGGLLILSAAGTKRDIYLYPLLPAFAILTGAFAFRQPRWVKTFLLGLGWLLAAVILVSGVISSAWDGEGINLHFSLNFWGLVGGGTILFLLLKTKLECFWKSVAIVAISLIAATLVFIPQVDRAKNYGPDTLAFIQKLRKNDLGRGCAWDLDETSRALLEFYGGINFFDIHDESSEKDRAPALKKLLAGQNPRFDFLIAMRKSEPFPPRGIKLDNNQVIAIGKLGQRRKLLLIDCRTTATSGDRK